MFESACELADKLLETKVRLCDCVRVLAKLFLFRNSLEPHAHMDRFSILRSHDYYCHSHYDL